MIDEPISNFMNPDVLKGDGDTPLLEVVRSMQAGAHGAFVVCEDDVPVGLVSERDAIEILAGSLAGGDYGRARVADVMTSPIQTLPENATMGELIRTMKEHDFRRVPITDEKDHLSGIVNLSDLQAATNAALERRGRDLEVAVMARTAELQAANAKLERLSLHDSLTGLLNRRAMAEKLDVLHGLSRRYGNAYSVILADIDHFKDYNDALGHLQGDDTLRRISTILADSVRTEDSVYRYGGEEFLIALPETAMESAGEVARRMRENVEAAGIPHPHSSVSDRVTLSFGYGSIGGPEASRIGSWETVVEEADRALYRAKQRGRNRVVASDDLD